MMLTIMSLKQRISDTINEITNRKNAALIIIQVCDFNPMFKFNFNNNNIFLWRLQISVQIISGTITLKNSQNWPIRYHSLVWYLLQRLVKITNIFVVMRHENYDSRVVYRRWENLGLLVNAHPRSDLFYSHVYSMYVFYSTTAEECHLLMASAQ